MRVAGVNIPKEKRLVIALRYVYGIGPTLAGQICKKTQIDESIRVKDLTNEEQDKLRAIIEKEYNIEGDLRREVAANVKRLKDIKSYRGTRHVRRLPVRGQRTKRNSRTVRSNKRSTMGSGRKPSAQKT